MPWFTHTDILFKYDFKIEDYGDPSWKTEKIKT